MITWLLVGLAVLLTLNAMVVALALTRDRSKPNQTLQILCNGPRELSYALLVRASRTGSGWAIRGLPGFNSFGSAGS
jgi:hypothetical protein